MLYKDVVRGNPLEYTPEEKPPFAVERAVALASPQMETWAAEPRSAIKIESHSYSAKGGASKWSNDIHTATGTVPIRKHTNAQVVVDGKTLIKSVLRPVVVQKFTIEFEDCLDNLGRPDIKINKFELT